MNTTVATWTPETVDALLVNNPRAVERAIVALFARQTEDEKSSDSTRHSNSRGFNAADARKLSFIAKFLGEGKHLKTETCKRYVAIVRKYRAQLADIANAKALAAAGVTLPASVD